MLTTHTEMLSTLQESTIHLLTPWLDKPLRKQGLVIKKKSLPRDKKPSNREGREREIAREEEEYGA